MPDAPRSPFAYAILRVVPRIDRGEFLNAGVVLLCRPRRFLAARIHLDPARLVALAPGADPDLARARLEALAAVAAGDPHAGPIARMTRAERFHWIVSPASTIVQPSEVHTGMTDDPAGMLDHLFRTLVEVEDPSRTGVAASPSPGG